MMQLMPSLAEQHHLVAFPNQPYDADQLFQSGYNVSLGTTELMGLLDAMKDIPLADPLPLVIAGYNGGEEAVRVGALAAGGRVASLLAQRRAR